MPALLGAVVLIGALAMPAGAAPPPWAGPPGSGSSTPATLIAICCTWGDNIDGGISYQITGTSDPDVLQAIRAGVTQWNTAVSAGLFQEVTSNAEVTVRFKRGGGSIAGSTSRSGSGAFITGASVTLSGKAFGQDALNTLATVTAHEFGHVLGLNHANGTGLLMSPVLDWPAVPDVQACDRDAAEVALAWFLPGGIGSPTAPPSSYTCGT